jgi:serine/threonine protein phosphatase PrpC
MAQEVQQRLLSEPTEDTLTWAFHKAASEIKRSGIDCRESGSTTVSCLRRGDSLLVANVGDSRCVMGREEGGTLKAKDLSMDHKPERQTEYERITRSNGFVEPSRAFGGRYVGPARVWAVKQQVGGLAVSRAIGDTNLNSVGVIPTPEVIKEQVRCQPAQPPVALRRSL